MAGFSKLATAALLAAAGACFATSIVIVYVLLRKDEEDVYEGLEAIKSSRHTVIEVPVPSNVIGGVIGRSGANIASIQQATNTRINFKDEVKGCTNRVAIIRGKPKDAQAAERLVRLAIAERLSITSEDIHIPVKACGFIIGKNGQNVRMIRDVSKAKIALDSSGTSGDFRRVTITGTRDEIQTAKALIEEDVAKATVPRKNGGKADLSTANSVVRFHGRQLCVTSAAENDISSVVQRPRLEELVPTGADGFLEVFVSFVESPSRFCVQPAIRVKAVELDKLVEQMTDFYQDESNAADYRVAEVSTSDLLAAPFSDDPSWYRVEVLSVEEDEYDADASKVTVHYVDFGDRTTLKKSKLRTLGDDFKRLPLQASECELSEARPVGAEWSEEAVKEFKTLTHCALWINVMMKTVRENPGGARTVELVDSNGETDIYVAKELVKRGLAQLEQQPLEDPKTCENTRESSP